MLLQQMTKNGTSLTFNILFQNSIRHNLSLHNRFMRVQNEGTGKSSWWMINPDAKPGKSVRRRAASMETSKFEKRRGRVKKKVCQNVLYCDGHDIKMPYFQIIHLYKIIPWHFPNIFILGAQNKKSLFSFCPLYKHVPLYLSCNL